MYSSQAILELTSSADSVDIFIGIIYIVLLVSLNHFFIAITFLHVESNKYTDSLI